MKKNKKIFSFYWFIIIFLLISLGAATSILLYEKINEATKGNEILISILILGNILFVTIIFFIIDILRRKFFIEKPLNEILYLTDEIAKGNFKVKINYKFKKYNSEYDDIIYNIKIMIDELNKNKLLKEDFISNFSHEIKTPIQVMKNYINLLKNPKTSIDEKDEYLIQLTNTLNRLSNLVTNILKLNKLENQVINIDKEEFDLSEELRTSILNYVEKIDEKNINLELDIIDNLIIKNDKSYIEIIFNNLISNAVKFTNPNGKIYISLKKIKNKYEFVVKDSGIGISKDIGEHIFDKFYQGDTSHKEEGNGLGLALVKQVIDLLGGEIKLYSVLNEGTTFTVLLGE